MVDYRDLLNVGADRRDEAAAKVARDLKGLDPPSDPTAAVAYWDCLRSALGDEVQEAVAVAREAGRQWAEIAGALNTSTESARGRHQYFKGTRS